MPRRAAAPAQNPPLVLVGQGQRWDPDAKPAKKKKRSSPKSKKVAELVAAIKGAQSSPTLEAVNALSAQIMTGKAEGWITTKNAKKIESAFAIVLATFGAAHK